MRFLRSLGLAFGMSLSLSPLAAPAQTVETETMRFTASILGVTAGRATLAVNRSGDAYAVTGQTSSAGLAGLFSSFKVTNKVRGSERNGTFRPERYESRAEGERRGRGAEIVYEGGVPKVLTLEAERRPGAPVLDPATQAGKVDPLTMTYALLRDTPRDQACTLRLEVFDGHRASRVALGNPRADGDDLLCDGVYSRVDGYPPEDLEERRDFTFTVTYTPLADGRMRPAVLVLDSLYGTARLARDE